MTLTQSSWAGAAKQLYAQDDGLEIPRLWRELTSEVDAFFQGTMGKTFVNTDALGTGSEFKLETAIAGSVINIGQAGTYPGRGSGEHTTTGAWDYVRVNRRYLAGAIRARITALMDGASTVDPNANRKSVVLAMMRDMVEILKTFARRRGITAITGAYGGLFQIAATSGATQALNGTTGRYEVTININTTPGRNYLSNTHAVQVNMPVQIETISGHALLAGTGGNLEGHIIRVPSASQVVVELFTGRQVTTVSALNDAHAVRLMRRADADLEAYGLADLVGTGSFPFGTNERGLDPATFPGWGSIVIGGSPTTAVQCLDTLANRLHQIGGMELLQNLEIITTLPACIQMVDEVNNNRRWAPNDKNDARPGGFDFFYAGHKINYLAAMPAGQMYAIDPTTLAMDDLESKRPQWVSQAQLEAILSDQAILVPETDTPHVVGHLIASGNRMALTRQFNGVCTAVPEYTGFLS